MGRSLKLFVMTHSCNFFIKVPTLPDLAVVQSGDSIQKDKQSNEGSWEEHPCVPA